MSPTSLALVRFTGPMATGFWSTYLTPLSLCPGYVFKSNSLIPFVLSVLWLQASSSLYSNSKPVCSILGTIPLSIFYSSILECSLHLHLEHGYTDPTKDNFRLATTLRGIPCIKGLTVSQKEPVTPKMLLDFKYHLDLDNPLHAVCLVAFFGLLRKGNLLSKGLAQFNQAKLLWHGDIFFFTDWVIAVNRWSKTIQFS